MKKLFAVLLVLVLLFLTACGTTPIVASESDWTETDIKAECVPVGITVNEDGYYCIFADVDIDFYEGEISNIEITETALLSFQVSSLYGGGVYVIGIDDGAQIIDSLSELADELRQNGNEEAAERLDNILKIILVSGPYTSVST